MSCNEYYVYNSKHDYNGCRSPSPADSCDEEDRKLFLGGLSRDTTEDDIRNYFSKFGNVVNVNIKYDSVTGNPRGFAFVTFSENVVEQVIASGSHSLNNKLIVPKRATSRPMRKKIFVGGVDSSTPEEDIKKHFSRYGRVKDIEFPFDRQRCRRRQFCFVVFETESEAISACRHPKQRIYGRNCDIQKAQPQPLNNQQRRMFPMSSHVPNYNGYNAYNGNGYGYEDGGRRYSYYRRDNRRVDQLRNNWKYSRPSTYYGSPDENGMQRRRRYREAPL